MTSIAFQSIGQMRQALASGDYSSAELLDAMLAQISSRNEALNAIVTMDGDNARQQAKQADQERAPGQNKGLLHGIPITIKDSFQTAGMRTTSGFPPLKNYIPEKDALAVARLKAAGAIIIGKTNLPVLAGDFQCKNPIFGRSNNPWNQERTTGGSTGGGAAAVASGMSALELGSDLGGSVRVPAHYCGVFGFKPGAYRVSGNGHIPGAEAPGIGASSSTLALMATPGVLARSAADLKLGFNVIAGTDPEAPDFPPIRESADTGPSQYRIAWTAGFPGIPVSKDTQDMMAATAKALSDAGHMVEKAQPEALDFSAAREAWGVITGCLMGSGVKPAIRRMLKLSFQFNKDRSDMKRGAVKGLGFNFKHFADALVVRDTTNVHIEQFLQRYDLWLCPVTSGSAFPHSKPGMPVPVDDHKVDYLLACGGHTSLFNFSGHPVAILPAGKSADGMPLGIQLVTRRWQDEMLLNAAIQIEPLISGYQPPLQ
jgi:amidase